MDTMLAFAKAEEARSNGSKMKYYDYKKAIRRINKVKPKVASLGMSEDMDWTEETVYENGKWLIDLSEEPKIAGIKGSIWATPVLVMDGKEEKCFIKEK